MGRVLIRDQYAAEHWVDEGLLAFSPWRDCEVVEREPAAEAATAAEQVPASEAVAGDKPAKSRKPAAE